MNHLLKTKNEYKDFEKKEIENELHKGCFQHDMAYGDFKDLPRRTANDKLLRRKAFNFSK